MNLLNQRLASMFRTNGAEHKIEEKKAVRKDSLNTWDTERFYPPVRYKYTHGLLTNKKETMITLAIKLIPLLLISGWILMRMM